MSECVEPTAQAWCSLPRNESEASICLEVLQKNITDEGLELVAVRDVPVDHSVGEIAKLAEPTIKQVFVKGYLEQDALERKLLWYENLQNMPSGHQTSKKKQFLPTQFFKQNNGV
jgi:glutamate synthase (NADPH) large chain